MAIPRKTDNRSAFTLIELIIIIIVSAILGGVAIPKYIDYASRAKEAASRGTLGGVRSAIGHFYTDQMVLGAARYPTFVELATLGTVMQEALPPNPYNGFNGIRADTFASVAPPVDNTVNMGYCYDEVAGRFWLNSITAGVNENLW